MRQPEYIRPGDTIGFAAPSFGAVIEPYRTRFEVACRKLGERGYRLKTAPSVYKNDGIGISTDPESAARDLMDLYLDDSVDAVLSVGGGELMCETISHIDFKKLKEAEPKWFMGYSDNTNMLLPMVSLCEVPGIYGPCAPTFGKPWEETENAAMALLEGTELTVRGQDFYEKPWSEGDEEEEDPLAPYALTEPKILSSYLYKGDALRKADRQEEIRMEGILMGGCLDILTNLAGTGYDGVRNIMKKYGPVIWVLEACDLTTLSIRRAVWHLKQCGWFDTAAGFLIGRPLAAFGQDIMGVNQYNAVTDIVGDLRVPVVMDADIGHVSPMMPLIMGSGAVVTVQGNHIEVMHRPV